MRGDFRDGRCSVGRKVVGRRRTVEAKTMIYLGLSYTRDGRILDVERRGTRGRRERCWMMRGVGTCFSIERKRPIYRKEVNGIVDVRNGVEEAVEVPT